jgi:hypothetical protein
MTLLAPAADFSTAFKADLDWDRRSGPSASPPGGAPEAATDSGNIRMVRRVRHPRRHWRGV